MRYSLFAGGKRIRPILCMEAAHAVSDAPDGVAACACSLELIHTYSLIHDDLPALDNDDYRRGKLTNHKVFGDAMAILAGDALLTLAFQVLAKLPVSGDRRARLIAELATASGTVGGMIGGQVADLEGRRQAARRAQLLETIHRAKTGALLRASLRLGAIYAGADEAPLRGALLLWRARRAGVSDRGRHSGRGRVVGGARQDGGQGRAAAEDHIPRGLRPGDFAAHGGGGVRAGAPGAGAVRGAALRGCTSWRI